MDSKVIVRLANSATDIPVLYENCTKVIGVPMVHNKFFTGLTREEEEKVFNELIDGYYKAEDGAKRTLSREWLRDYKIRLGSSDLELDNNDISDRFKISILRVSKKIANSPSELIDNPTATHYLIDKVAQSKVESDKEVQRIEAGGIIVRMKNNPEKLVEFAMVLGDSTARKKSTEVLFNELLNMSKTRPDVIISLSQDPLIRHKSLLRDLVEYEIVRVDNDNYYYNSKVLGVSLEDAAAFLADKVNQDTYVTLSKRLAMVTQQFKKEGKEVAKDPVETVKDKITDIVENDDTQSGDLKGADATNTSAKASASKPAFKTPSNKNVIVEK